MKKILILFSLVLLLFSFTSDLQKKVIRDGEFDIVCYVSLKELNKFSDGKEYFWFKSSEIHNSISKVGGLPLHDEFNKFYRSKQLAESGTFNYGLKDGKWKSWYINGKLKTEVNWSNGYKDGQYLEYDKEGQIEISGTFRKNEKRSAWINHKQKDTTYFKGDSIYTTKPNSKLNTFFKRIIKRKDSTERTQIKKERIARKLNDSIERVKKKKSKKLKKHNDSIKKAQKTKKRN